MATLEFGIVAGSQIEDDFVMVNIEIGKYVSLISTQWAEAEL